MRMSTDRCCIGGAVLSVLHYSCHLGFVGYLCIPAHSLVPKRTTRLFRGSYKLGHYKLIHKMTGFNFHT